MALPDPTDYALATIASILEHSEPRHDADRAPAEKDSAGKASIEKAAMATKSSVEASPPPLPPEADGYSKVSPGPIAAIRVRWAVRCADNGEYFVDERLGEHSARRTSGPMAKDAAVKLVDDQEAEARRRFEQLRGEMSGRVAADADRGGEA